MEKYLVLQKKHRRQKDTMINIPSFGIVYFQQRQKIMIFAARILEMILNTTTSRAFFRTATALLALACACANPVAPTGGPKDVTPPEVTKSMPANQSVNFAGDRIVLTFSEFVSLKDINNQLVVSPPMTEAPEFSMRGKNLTIKFNEPLRENSTYNFFFGDAIVDLTEANPLTGFSFAFSTGPVLDSLSIKGRLINAFNLQPVKDAFVMLYDSIYDSVPYKQRPYYLAKTNKNGEFALNSLRDSQYLLFALTDINSNYLFDMPTEDIAFLDTLVRPLYHNSRPVATSASDSVAKVLTDTDVTTATDSAAQPDSSAKALPDSIAVMQEHDHHDHEGHDHEHSPAENATINPVAVSPGLPSYTLFHFREVDTTQRLLKGSVIRKNVISLAFRQPVRSLTLTTIEPVLSENWNITAWNKTRDTITLWLPEPGTDSLMLAVADAGMTPDTLDLALTPSVKTVSRSKETTPRTPVLSFKNNLKAGKLRPDRELILTFPDPVSTASIEKLKFFADTNLVEPDVAFSDSLQMFFTFHNKIKEGVNYRIEIPDSTFFNLFGHTNDSIALKFSALTLEETGMIKINIATGLPHPIIVQLTDEKEVVLEQRFIQGPSVLEFNYLPAKKYRLKAIIDVNGNGKWDTGNFLRKVQPEKVTYFPKEMELRSNWTMEEEWNIE